MWPFKKKPKPPTDHLPYMFKTGGFDVFAKKEMPRSRFNEIEGKINVFDPRFFFYVTLEKPTTTLEQIVIGKNIVKLFAYDVFSKADEMLGDGRLHVHLHQVIMQMLGELPEGTKVSLSVVIKHNWQ